MKPTFLIVDGFALLFRAYMSPIGYMRGPQGQPTAALYGFAAMLLDLVKSGQPDAYYVAWDRPEPTFRNHLFKEYKAHRPPIDEDLRVQIPIARELILALGIQLQDCIGFEADDVIGTYADKAAEAGYEVIIVTSDTDQLQLVREGVRVHLTRQGVSLLEPLDAGGVFQKLGVYPNQVADYKALMGDTSDNIPGVPGVGKVTAAKLLGAYGSLENLLDHVDELPERTATDRKIKTNLHDAESAARMSLTLTTIRCDAPVALPIAPYAPSAAQVATCKALFERLGFKSLHSRLATPTAAPATAEAAPEPALVRERRPIVVVNSAEEYRAAVAQARAGGVVALSVCRSSSGASGQMLGVGFCGADMVPRYVACREFGAEAEGGGGLFGAAPKGFAVEPRELSALIAEPIAWVSPNSKSDILGLKPWGLIPPPCRFDASLAGYLLDPGRMIYPIGTLVGAYLDVPEHHANGDTPEGSAARAAEHGLELEGPMTELLRDRGLLSIYRDLELPLAPILASMQQAGVLVDRPFLTQLAADMGAHITQLAQRIYELAGEEFLINSTQQLQRILYEKLGLATGRKIKTGFSTGAEALEALADRHEIAGAILEYREISKLKSTYADTLPSLVNHATGRVHTTLNQTVAATGRLSSSDPNMQNIPVRSEIGREIRRAFIAPPGHLLLSCDYSQIELRVFAHVTQDPEMLRAFRANEDIHAATAARLFGVPLEQVSKEQRRRAKTVNFGVIYGQSDFGLAGSLGIPVREAHDFIESYLGQFPGVREWSEQTVARARETGYVQTLYGRRRAIPDITSNNHNIRQAAERAAVNMPIQGAAADIMKAAMISVASGLPGLCYNLRLLLQVHDELLFEVPSTAAREAAEWVCGRMESAADLAVPLRVDSKVGLNWAEMLATKSLAGT